MLGSAALNMCMVAQGGADAYYEFGVHCWDIAAGDVILREAGGVTMYPTGRSYWGHRRYISMTYNVHKVVLLSLVTLPLCGGIFFLDWLKNDFM